MVVIGAYCVGQTYHNTRTRGLQAIRASVTVLLFNSLYVVFMSHSRKRKRSSTEELQKREEYAARLLEQGVDRASAVLNVMERYEVSRRTAQRCVNVAALEVIGDSMSLPQLDATVGLTLQKLMRMSVAAQEEGDLKTMVSIQKAIAGIANQRIRIAEQTIVKKMEWMQ